MRTNLTAARRLTDATLSLEHLPYADFVENPSIKKIIQESVLEARAQLNDFLKWEGLE